MRRWDRGSVRWAAAGLVALTLAGCASGPASVSLDYDPLEPQNRAAHGLNKSLDRAAYGPLARGYGAAAPEPVRNGLTNLVNHLSLPGGAIQYALQGKPEQVLGNTARFFTNTIFGFGGLLDPAAEMGLPFRETNVDETLYVWGVPEGGYLELPLGGPGTQRDWAGFALDIAADPVTYLTAGTDAAFAAVGLEALDLLRERHQLDPVVQALLYESADSYTAQRISYLQNMRARLQGGADLEALEDPYADF